MIPNMIESWPLQRFITFILLPPAWRLAQRSGLSLQIMLETRIEEVSGWLLGFLIIWKWQFVRKRNPNERKDRNKKYQALRLISLEMYEWLLAQRCWKRRRLRAKYLIEYVTKRKFLELLTCHFVRRKVIRTPKC